MKNLLSLFVLVLVLAGCQKENIQEDPTLVEDGVMQSDWQDIDIYTLTPKDGSPFQKLELSAEMLERTSAVETRNGNDHAHGNYSITDPRGEAFFYYRTEVQFAATENSQGTSGTASITRHWTDIFGDLGSGAFTINLDAVCLSVLGDGAVFGGDITSVTGDIPALPDLEDIVLAPGGRVIFKVQDNGQGANAPADEGHLIFLIDISGTLPCGLVPPDAFIWEFFFGNVPVDNPPSEQIVVK